MDETGKKVFNLARLKRTPREIETTLGLPPYRIHETYHRELMDGYLEAESVSPTKRFNYENCTNSDAREKRREYQRWYQEANKERIAEQRRKYRAANKEKLREARCRYRARKKNQGVLKVGN